MKTKPFNLEEYLKDPSQKVVTREGASVRIICTDGNDKTKPIVGFIGNINSTYTWTLNGIYYSDQNESCLDIVLLDNKSETGLTEFEKELLNLLIERTNETTYSKKLVLKYSTKLIDIARKQLKEEQWKQEFRKYQQGYEQGKIDTLKEMPKWKKFGVGIAGNRNREVFLIRNDGGTYYTSKVLSSDCVYLELEELEKLPKEE